MEMRKDFLIRYGFLGWKMSGFLEVMPPPWRIIPFSKWLGSPLFISHEKAIWKRNNPI